MQTSFAPGASSGLASVVIMIRMTMTPVPIRTLFFHLQFHKGVILSVPFAKVCTEGTVFVLIPIVRILVVTVIEPLAVIVVTMVFFLTPVVLWLGRSTHYRRRSQCCSKYKKAEQIFISTLHFRFPSWLKTPISDSFVSKEYAVIRLEVMFDSALLPS
jgi:hypothetical protein